MVVVDLHSVPHMILGDVELAATQAVILCGSGITIITTKNISRSRSSNNDKGYSAGEGKKKRKNKKKMKARKYEQKPNLIG